MVSESNLTFYLHYQHLVVINDEPLWRWALCPSRWRR